MSKIKTVFFLSNFTIFYGCADKDISSVVNTESSSAKAIAQVYDVAYEAIKDPDSKEIEDIFSFDIKDQLITANEPTKERTVGKVTITLRPLLKKSQSNSMYAFNFGSVKRILQSTNQSVANVNGITIAANFQLIDDQNPYYRYYSEVSLARSDIVTAFPGKTTPILTWKTFSKQETLVDTQLGTNQEISYGEEAIEDQKSTSSSSLKKKDSQYEIHQNGYSVCTKGKKIICIAVEPIRLNKKSVFDRISQLPFPGRSVQENDIILNFSVFYACPQRKQIFLFSGQKAIGKKKNQVYYVSLNGQEPTQDEGFSKSSFSFATTKKFNTESYEDLDPCDQQYDPCPYGVSLNSFTNDFIKTQYGEDRVSTALGLSPNVLKALGFLKISISFLKLAQH
jgi:hypothetical protein